MSRCCTYIRHLLLTLSALCLLWSCDVHEFPDPRETVAVRLHLEHSTKMYRWENGIVTDTVDVVQTKGTMRYTVRVYSGFATRRDVPVVVQEHSFTRDLAGAGYDYSMPLELPEGDYTIMVWTDLLEPQSKDNEPKPFYDIKDFNAIRIPEGDYKARTDYRDAFRGVSEISLKSSSMVVPEVDCHVTMQRPLAKYEFLATDFRQFLTKEILKKMASIPHNANIKELATRAEIDKYRAVIYYSGFMPCEYNMFIDKPVDSKRGVMFESKITEAHDELASLCFDYVMVNGTSASVAVQIVIFDPKGEQVSQTNAITVPLKRNHHTIMLGSFLMQQASGGIVIQPEFDGDHNVVIP